ncbi:type II toxin-antitoxin system PemK/MazF family toxin [Lysinibacillus fusiformis]|uniref:type II toxin-antitoxin system PemK/MazF family toxin n=1 Tax=Lysinibacillus fusiformis TaxID=28031 RepID=UPI003AAA3A45
MKIPKTGEVWYGDYPKEENPSEIMKNRPCIILDFDEDNQEVMVIKLTRTPPRDLYDYELKHWAECGLKSATTARISKISNIDYSDLHNKKGQLHPNDELIISQILEELSKEEDD